MKVQIYVTQEQKQPFATWIGKLKDAKGRAVINARIGRLRLGNFGDCKAIGDGVSELRINFGPGYRVYFGKSGEEVVLLLCGGDKDSQPSDVTKAKELWAEYKSRATKG